MPASIVIVVNTAIPQVEPNAESGVSVQTLSCPHGDDADSLAFASATARLDELQQLRYVDPARALLMLASEQGLRPGCTEAEQALLQARVAMQVGSAHVVLGAHGLAQPEFDRMLCHLRHPALAAASIVLQRQARRCEAAGANARAVLAHAVGDMAGALSAYLQALDVVRELGERRHEAHVLVNLANTFEETGLPEEALEHLRMALELATVEGMDELLGDVHHNMGNALAATGEVEAGLASNRRALTAYDNLSLSQKQRYALVAVAERLLELGRPGEAQAELAKRATLPEDYTNQQYEAYAAYLAGRIAAAQGQGLQAQAVLETARSLSAALADPVGQSRALLELARIDLHAFAAPEAAARADEALALLAQTAATRDQMRAHEMAYSAASAQGRSDVALHHHEHFHKAYVRCVNGESATKARLLAVLHEVDLARADARSQRLENARLTEALAEISARLSGAPSPAGALRLPVRPQDLQSLGLTHREAEILFWVTQGKTNEDVVSILGTSLSTVKKHLASVYRKLGVENRTAAANMARQRAVSSPISGPRNE